jgi:hypothetical protein
MYFILQVHLRSHFIMNGVCVRWRGWIDLERLDGVGCLEYDEEKAQVRRQLDSEHGFSKGFACRWEPQHTEGLS